MFSDIELDYGSIPGGTPVIPISYIGISRPERIVFFFALFGYGIGYGFVVKTYLSFLFSSKQDSDKLDLLNKRILRFIFKDFNSEYNNLLKKAGTANLKDKRLQNMILTIFKCLHFSDYPRYLKDMFRLRSSTYFLRGHNMLCLPKPLTTSYGINSFSYLAATSWNSLPDHYRTISDFTSFRRLISTGNNNLLKRAGTANLSTSC